MKNFAVFSLVLLLGVLGPQRESGSRFDAAWELGLLMLAAFLAQQAARSLRLPPLTGWMAAGLLLGPSGLQAVSVDSSLQLIHAAAAIWVGFQAGLVCSLPAPPRQPTAALGLSTLAVFLTSSAALALLARLPWELALLLGALASLWGPFTTGAVLEHREAIAWGITGNGFGLLLLSGVLVFLHAQGRLPEEALRFAGMLWLSLLTGALAAWLLSHLRAGPTPALTLAAMGGGFLLAALLLNHLGLCALLFGLAAGWVAARRPDHGPHLRHSSQPAHALLSLLFFALAGAAIDLRGLWPPAPGLFEAVLLQLLALILLRGLVLSRFLPAGTGAFTWLLLPRFALLFALLYYPGGGLAELLAEGQSRLLRQAAVSDLLLHAFLFSTLALAVCRPWRPPAIVQR